MHKINFANSTFIKSAPDQSQFLYDKKSVVFLGKSNVGKSSLINKILNKNNFMRVSSTPGRTTMLNYILVDKDYYIIDAPGYGFVKSRLNFESMMLEFFNNANENIKLTVLLVDSRRLLSNDDKMMIELLKKYELPYLVCYTKKDKLRMKEVHLVKKEIETLNLNALLVSSLENYNIEVLKDVISRYLTE